MLLPALLLALLLAGCGGRASSAEPFESPWEHYAAGWTRLPPPPALRARVAAVWTGREVIVWGGDTDLGGRHHADGAAYDPVTRAWTELPPSPLGPRSSAAAVWTGRELLIWGGSTASAYPDADGAAYNPSVRSWRMLPPSPLDGARVPVAAEWTGRELIVWGDTGRSGEVVDGAAYDPVADRWRRLPDAPIALNEASATWTGKELVVFGALLDVYNASKKKHAEGIAYDPARNEWRRIAPYPFSPQASWAAWTGRVVVTWDYELTAAAYDPARNTWRQLPRLPLDFSECYPESVVLEAVLFAWHCGGPAALLETDDWSVVAPPDGIVWGAPLAAGEAVVFVGASHEGRDGSWVYKPTS